MEIELVTGLTDYLRYDELRTAFAQFEFSGDLYSGHGKIKKQSSGRCKFAAVQITIQNTKPNYANIFNWEVTEAQIPMYFFDRILTTIKSIISEHPDRGHFKIAVVNGESHAVDSDCLSYEIATLKAMANLIGFDLENYCI